MAKPDSFIVGSLGDARVQSVLDGQGKASKLSTVVDLVSMVAPVFPALNTDTPEKNTNILSNLSKNGLQVSSADGVALNGASPKSTPSADKGQAPGSSVTI